jgi:hypothetical protein
MTSYKQKIIDIINNEDNKKLLNNNKTLNNDNLFTHFLKKYTEACIDYPNKDNGRAFEDLYYEISRCIKRINYKNKFKNTWGKDLDQVIKFVDCYKRNIACYDGSYKTKLNKQLNESIENNFKSLHNTIINGIKEDFDNHKNNCVLKKDSVRKPTYRQKTNAEVLKKLYTDYIKKLEIDEVDLSYFK